MARKGVLPLKLAKESTPSFLIDFKPWTITGKTASTILKIRRSTVDASATIKVHLSSQVLNGKVFLQGKSTVLIPVGDQEVNIPISALVASEGNFELMLEINPLEGKTEFFKSPYLINLP